jgi:hypothetical protein
MIGGWLSQPGLTIPMLRALDSDINRRRGADDCPLADTPRRIASANSSATSHCVVRQYENAAVVAAAVRVQCPGERTVSSPRTQAARRGEAGQTGAFAGQWRRAASACRASVVMWRRPLATASLTPSSASGRGVLSGAHDPHITPAAPAVSRQKRRSKRRLPDSGLAAHEHQPPRRACPDPAEQIGKCSKLRLALQQRIADRHRVRPHSGQSPTQPCSPASAAAQAAAPSAAIELQTVGCHPSGHAKHG